MPSKPPETPDVALTLALAVVSTSMAPLLLLDDDLKIIAASASFAREFGLDPDHVVGALLFDLGAGEWDIRQLRILLTATAAGEAEIEAYEMDLVRPGKNICRLVLNAHKVKYAIDAPVRLLLTISDVTHARAAARTNDDLLREKGVLMQELQHRIANSLQIIASVILQSARKTTSQETRRHLGEAHSRVMSVATLQQQLSTAYLGPVGVRAYLEKLCASIDASMIRDHDELVLRVTADDSEVEADISVSLGLIVTELVINSLKHAYPDERGGEILVEYHATDTGWLLSVGDDGVGMPKGKAEPAAGLGTTIVHALARKLNATILVTDADPGTLVTVVNSETVVVTAASEPAV